MRFRQIGVFGSESYEVLCQLDFEMVEIDIEVK